MKSPTGFMKYCILISVIVKVSPRTMNIIARVTMIGTSFKRAMMKPFTAPTAAPAPTAIRSATPSPAPALVAMTHNADDR